MSEVSTVIALENAIQELEGITVVLRRRGDELVYAYDFQQAAKHSFTVLDYLNRRLGSCGIKPEEVVIIDGYGKRHLGHLTGKMTIGSLRETYKARAAA